MKYLIWKSPYLEENLYNFHRLNNLRELTLTPQLYQWALSFQLQYPNQTGTERWADPIICNNSNSNYYNAVAMPILDAVYDSLTPQLIEGLQQIGISMPDEGIESAISQLPADWVVLPVVP